ncbi:hypothetical protein BBO99_00001679 [Phytophthora kernoviae]|uniref:CG-1 domain-containing protein n=2 Tax=Phytophthora kernoviae TaxID=325452 RepID=A0A3R7H1I5_9STRA|nr:hypothetical protein G195_005067 [Phytophthora kernoviae 00238/432]KAG2525750.1 hypothetical protein JM16_003992 [Phytophthora kernoviae]KAG2527333.1 hypothetical protein JM18_003814 [Phytophthora kernoviae]RLN31876.1 hypothetical protein BBI17_000470 [Phytophthora kernoviae]RLN83964.1 hypothetical protein BBO99_00001679 [Phytophthora kernoviae]
MTEGDGIQARAASLRQDATRRWLVKDELVFLLLYYKLVDVPVLHSLQLRPPSGTLLFYNTLKVPDYKKDGWHWQKRKDKSGRVREDRAKLVINRQVIILGSYVHSAETSVHISSEDLFNCFEMDFEPHSTSLPNPAASVSDVDLLLLKDNAMDGITTVFGDDDLFNDLTSAASPDKKVSGVGGQQTFELAVISDFSPDWDFGDGGAKILICLAAKLPEELAQDPVKLFVQFGSKRIRAEKVSDTVLRCTGISIALDDCTIESLSDNDLEQLSEKLLERVVRQLVTIAHTSEDLLEELNSLDETGLSLLHYQSTQGQTALHLAAGCGHEEVVDVLLQSGADLQVRDFDGLTPADRAEKSGHTGVAAKLRHHVVSNMVGMDTNLIGGRLLLSGGENDSDVQSVIAEDEEGLTKLQAAMELMGPEERQSLEDEVTVLQHGIRAWLLKRNCKSMRETTKQLREATQSIKDQQKQQEAAERHAMMANELSERERAAVTVQAATRSMLARRTFLQTKHVAIKFQAATRGVLCRKNFARMKAHALASLVIQRNVREWWNKQPAATRPGGINEEPYDQDKEDKKAEDKESMPPETLEDRLHEELHLL